MWLAIGHNFTYKRLFCFFLIYNQVIWKEDYEKENKMKTLLS